MVWFCTYGKIHYSEENTIVLASHKHRTYHALECTKFGGKQILKREM